jgi:hypothetical protein
MAVTILVLDTLFHSLPMHITRATETRNRLPVLFTISINWHDGGDKPPSHGLTRHVTGRLAGDGGDRATGEAVHHQGAD